MVETRLELVAVEVQEEKLRLIRTSIWFVAVLFSALLALGFGGLAFVAFCAEENRPAALGALALFFGLAALASGLFLRRLISRDPRPFDASLKEFREDRACIRKAN